MLATFAKEKNGYPSTSEKGEKREEKVPPPKKKEKKIKHSKSFRSDGQHTACK